MAVPGYGTTIAYSTTSGGTYTPLSEVVDLKPPAVECDDIETTHMLSTNKVRTFVSGLKNGGEIEVTIHYEKSLEVTLRSTLFAAAYFWKITFNDIGSTASTLVVPGYIKKIGDVIPLDGIDTVELTMKVSGDATFTAGT